MYTTDDEYWNSFEDRFVSVPAQEVDYTAELNYDLHEVFERTRPASGVVLEGLAPLAPGVIYWKFSRIVGGYRCKEKVRERIALDNIEGGNYRDSIGYKLSKRMGDSELVRVFD